MPRKARIIVPGAIYHVMARCLDGQRLFHNDGERELFVRLLSEYIFRCNCRCYAWALMDNHYHLVLRLGSEELWEVMKPLNMRYSQYHAKENGRRGPLFMDRFKSIVTQDQNYLQELVRYVHLNPLRAGVVGTLGELARYPWCGDGALMGKRECTFQDTGTVLRRFGRSDIAARQEYRAFLREGVSTTDSDGDAVVSLVRKSNAGSEHGRGPACWVIGDPAFVADAVKESQVRKKRTRQLVSGTCTLEQIAHSVGREFGLPPDAFRQRCRGGVAAVARKAFAHTAAREFGAPLNNIGEYLGVGPAAVSFMVQTARTSHIKACIAK